MSAPARIIRTTCTNPFINLAFEEHLFTNLTVPTLLLWRNATCVIIGRHQNPWKECHIDRMNEDGVTMVRRKSGGGTVYQDLGNSIFSFMEQISLDHDFKKANNDILISALNTLGIKAEATGRNDLTYNDKKISGAAFKLDTNSQGTKSLHHGTLLIDVNMNAVPKYLNPNKAKLESKGISSVASRVMNLIDEFPELNNGSFNNSLDDAFSSKYGAVEREVIDETLMPEDVLRIAAVLEDWNWRYGESPKFSHELETRFEWGILDLNLQVESGKIEQVKVFSDAMDVSFINGIQKSFQGKEYGAEGLDRVGGELRKWFPDHEEKVDEMVTWLNEVM